MWGGRPRPRRTPWSGSFHVRPGRPGVGRGPTKSRRAKKRRCSSADLCVLWRTHSCVQRPHFLGTLADPFTPVRAPPSPTLRLESRNSDANRGTRALARPFLSPETFPPGIVRRSWGRFPIRSRQSARHPARLCGLTSILLSCMRAMSRSPATSTAGTSMSAFLI